MTTITSHRFVLRVTPQIAMLASVAALLAACAQKGSTLPHISAAQVDSGDPLPEGILPNGLMYQPYAD